jgi:hypothetical protein
MKIKMNKNLGRRKCIVVDILSIEEKNLACSLEHEQQPAALLPCRPCLGARHCDGVQLVRRSLPFIVVSC